MIYLNSITKKPFNEHCVGYPFDLPVVDHLDQVNFDNPVTFLVGENGSGKSTLLESIAVGLNIPSISSQLQSQDERFSGARLLSRYLKYIRKQHQKKSFFFRSEDFVGFVDQINATKKELDELNDQFSDELSGYGKILATGMVKGQASAIQRRYGENMHSASHGEGLFRVFQSRLVANGLYLIDEPEASLSPLRQLSLMSLMAEMVKKGSQFIIATHSPILMAFPQATIFDVESNPISPIAYDDCEHVSITRDFLRSPEQFLQYLIEDT